MGDVHASPVAAAPVLRDPNPAGAVGVLFAVAVPVELDLDPAVLVRVNGLARRADDDSRLGALDHRLLDDEGRAKWQGRGDAAKLVLIDKLLAFARAIPLGQAAAVLDAREDILPVAVEVPFQSKLVAGDELAAIASAPNLQAGQRFLLHADLDGAFVVLVNFL